MNSKTESSADHLKRELLDANAMLRTVIDENPNIILMKDWDGKFLIGNRALADLYGTTPEDLVGKDDGAFNPNAEQVEFFLKNVQEIMSQSDTKVVMEESTNAATGEVSYYQSIKKPLTTADGKKQILVIANDVSELKRVQKRLEESERRLRYVLDATREGIWDWDIKAGIVTHNLQWCKIIGFDDDHLEHPLEEFAALLHEDDRALVLERLQHCLDGKSRYQSEHRMRLQDQRVVWVLDRGDVVEWAEDGSPSRMVGSFVDINERKAAELALGVRTELLNAIFELSPDAFISFDGARRVSYVSPAFTRMTEIEVQQLNGLGEEEFTVLLAAQCLPAGRFLGVERLRESAARGKSNEREFIELAHAGNRILEVGLRSSDSSAVSQILYFRDVTHETEVDRMKSEFLSTAAHELRSPMASIFGFTELLLMQKNDEAAQRESLEIIYKQSKLMAQILDELLDLARIEARRGKDFNYTRVCVPELTADLIKTFKYPEGRKPPQLVVPDSNAFAMADAGKLRQAILNVLVNAYKFSPGGGDVVVEVVLPVPTSAGATPMLCVHVSDQGIGMTPEQLDKVCTRFYRADKSGKVPGTGLGMSIVKEIVELHRGNIGIVSALGKGTRVSLCLPLRMQTDAQSTATGNAIG